MNRLALWLLVSSLVVGCARAQTYNATVTVLDESGQPVTSADVEMSFYIVSPPGQPEAGSSVHGLTDTNGICRLSHVNTGSISLGFRAAKTGYYPATTGHEFAKFRDVDPAKWAPSVTLMLKKIGNPIPMFAKAVNLGMPLFGTPIGFDLEAGDWVAPHGKGKTTDILFEAQLNKRAENDSDYRLTVSFPRRGDGIQEFVLPSAQQSCALRSPSEAPESGYLTNWTQIRTRRPGKPVAGNWDENRNYFFRVKTVLDPQGRVQSALYGKIYGDFLRFTYYLNPTPNTRNVEFDPSKNLLRDLRPSEEVQQP